MGNSVGHYGKPQKNQHLMSEVIRIFSILPEPEQRVLMSSFLRIAGGAPIEIRRPNLVQGLTAREQEVLVLVANGYTRREIGKTLQISANTAAKHIAKIYSKLDITTSAEAARVSVVAGLVG